VLKIEQRFCIHILHVLSLFQAEDRAIRKKKKNKRKKKKKENGAVVDPIAVCLPLYRFRKTE